MSNHSCLHCMALEAQVMRFADWLQEQESAYAEKHLRLSRLANMQPQASTANIISKTMTRVLEQFDRVIPDEQPRTQGLMSIVRNLIFG